MSEILEEIFKKPCYWCKSGGMDMDMDPYCVRKEVISLRIAQPDAQKTYPYGLSCGRARSLCGGKFYEVRK